MLEEWFLSMFGLQKLFNLWNSVQQALSHVSTSVLYKLRYAHPAIDGVGFLTETSTNKVWLVFIQVSLSSYQHHNSKLKDIHMN